MKHSLSASSRIVDFTLFILIVLVSSFSLSYSSTGGNQPWYYMSGGYGSGIPATNVWGNNSQGQCNAPVSVKGNPEWNLRNIAGGEFHSAALIDNTGYGAAFGNVVAWGDNTSGQCLGTDATGAAIIMPPTADGTVPVQIFGATLSGVNTIRSGYKHNLALAGGALIAWGDNTYDQITIPDDVQFNISSIAAGGYHSMALVENSVRAWGRNGNSQCSPPLAAYSGVSAIAGGGFHSLALKNNGVLAWGAGKTNTGTNNNFGQSIVPNAAKSGVMAIAGGGFHSVALMYGDGYGVAFGSLVAWGRNNEGQCSIPDAASSGVSDIACGTYNTLALRNGVVIAWGAGTTNSGTNNEFGQSIVPSYLQSVSAIAAGGFHSLAIGLVADTDGDGWNDLVDNCVSVYNPSQADCNNNGNGDACELASGSAQDSDGNGIPDSCEDMDGDGVVDSQDRCPLVAGSSFCGGCPETVCNTPSIRTWVTNAFNISDPGGYGYGQAFNTSISIDSSAAATAVGNETVTVTLQASICGWNKWFDATLVDGNNQSILTFPRFYDQACIYPQINTQTITVAAFNQLIQSGQFRIDIYGQPQYGDSTVAWDVKVSFTYSGVGLPQAGSDTDSDGVPIEQDLCPTIAGPCNGCTTNVCGGCGAALDTDGDVTPDCIDDDDDNDSVADYMDAFPLDASESLDTDNDGIGNNADTDDDGDGFDDATDLCPLDANKSEPGQCGCGVPDTDTDGDGILDCVDNCVLIANPNQADCNGDAVGDACEIASGAPDCNANGIPDSCDLQSGVLKDLNGNGYPDSCEIAGPTGGVAAWGNNDFGQRNIPTAALSGVSAIAGGYGHTIALTNTGAVLAWGYNDYGQCNIPASANSGVSAIAGGYFHTIALKDGAVLAWGYNDNGQCTIPDSANSGVSAIAGGYFHTIALKDGAVLAWGYNGSGQCTIPASANSGVSAIAGGVWHTIALKDGAVLAWGDNYYGQCTIPASANSGVSAIAGGYGHTIALKDDSSVIAWGQNGDGECLGTDPFGNPNTAPALGQPVRIMGVTLSGITAIAGGSNGSTMALKSDGSVLAWGSNNNGQCTIPENLGFCTAIAAGGIHAIAIQIDCNHDGVADATQTIANPELDQNHNYQLDSCEIGTGTEEDCNHNGVLDLVEQGLNTPIALASQKLSPIGYGQDASGNTNSKTWTIATPANAISDPVLEIKAFGDFSLTTEYITVFMNSRFIGNYFKYPAKDCSEISQTLTIPLEIFNSIIAGSDGSTADLVIDFMPSIAVDAQACNNGSWIKGSLSYTSAVGADCNANGLLDECETRDYPETTDFNGNGIVDECESGGSIGSCPGDLDHNRVLDSGDVSMVLLNIGIITMPGDPLDLDNNGVVDSGDVSWILLNTGDCP
jgi:alpha-tubulin suppressor-like RCC1 family protein